MAIQFNMQNLLQTLICPIDRELLTTAVNLTPCCHKINQVAAETHYGKMIGNACESKGKRCVVCNMPVLSYAIDHTVRNVAAQALKLSLVLESLEEDPRAQSSQPVFPGAKERPPLTDEESLPLQGEVPQIKTDEIDPVYPGSPAVFVHKSGDWDKPFDSGRELRRAMIFKSITKNSLLKKFTLLGYCDGHVAISVAFTDRSFRKYLLAHQCMCEDHDGFCYKTKTHENLKTLFHIISSNNEIPREQLNKIAEIVDKGCYDCHIVPKTKRRYYF